MKTLTKAVCWSAITLCVCFIAIGAETTTAKPKTTSSPTPTRPNTTTTSPTPTPKLSCEERNSSCGSCTDDYECYWCEPDSTCKPYKVSISQLTPKGCKGNKWYWKQCAVPGYVLIIVVPSLVGVILISLGCCIYCCCCRSRGRKGYEREEDRIRQRREENRQRSQERRAERKQRTDAIRQKYGLLTNTDDENEIV
ncbi:pituitary tumor-transforming gene 1 protein-interacting protein [Nematostella vectensis]|uniref:pituitary tumor-transforming gene 1 protein-interacting protein n=1 Tax=Nematostella vectensis TaxID=45351 RepID=UPI0020778309|nr:pituitary tumor-transforming gene 1 protein-interacting protein [Nematostella vectensis]